MSRVTAIISLLWLSASMSAWSCNKLIITVITPLPTKPSATKMPGELKLANAAITDMQMRHADVAALDAKYTKELADKAENDALRDDAAAGQAAVAHQSKVCQSCEATTASGVDNAASPDWQTPLNGIYFTSERLITMKTTGRNPEVY